MCSSATVSINVWTDPREIFITGQTWYREQMIKIWCCRRLSSGSRVLFHFLSGLIYTVSRSWNKLGMAEIFAFRVLVCMVFLRDKYRYSGQNSALPSGFDKIQVHLWHTLSQIAKFMGPTWGPPGSCRPQMGPMLAPWTLLSGMA